MLLPRLERGVEIVDGESAIVIERANTVDNNAVRPWRGIAAIDATFVSLTVEGVEGGVVNPISH